MYGIVNSLELQTRVIQHIVKDRIHKGTAATDLIKNLTTTDVRTCPHVKYNDNISVGGWFIIIIMCVHVCMCVFFYNQMQQQCFSQGKF